jgi:hypothetical protein
LERLRGKNNPMYGTSWKVKWENTLSKEEFSEKLQVLKKQHSLLTSGSNNPMFGKPSPLKSGRGRSGSWNDLPFRSLLELAFLEWYYNLYNEMPKSAERKEKSVILPSGRTYFPDFEGKDGHIFEIKPSKLLEHNSEKITAGKQKYGKLFVVKTELDLPGYKNIHLRLETFSNLLMHYSL